MKKKLSEHRSLIGIALSILQLLLSVGFLYYAYQFNVFPVPYLIGISIALFLVWLLVLLSQALPHVYRINRIGGQVLNVLLVMALLVGTNMLDLGMQTVQEVKGSEFSTDRISIITLEGTPDVLLQDIIAQPIGILRFMDVPNTHNTLDIIQQANE
ncbi:MAG: hypothetical protein ACRDBX_02690, partial [Erysipelotrichaceae bacterium]